jgi:hypothetical protein
MRNEFSNWKDIDTKQCMCPTRQLKEENFEKLRKRNQKNQNKNTSRYSGF